MVRETKCTYYILKFLAFAIDTRQYLRCGVSLQWKMGRLIICGILELCRQLTHLSGGGTTIAR